MNRDDERIVTIIYAQVHNHRVLDAPLKPEDLEDLLAELSEEGLERFQKHKIDELREAAVRVKASGRRRAPCLVKNDEL